MVCQSHGALPVNLPLPPDLEQRIQRQMASGRYATASEVVREGLRLLEDRDAAVAATLAALRTEVGAGLAELDAGHGEPVDAGTASRIKDAGRRRLDHDRNR